MLVACFSAMNLKAEGKLDLPRLKQEFGVATEERIVYLRHDGVLSTKFGPLDRQKASFERR